MGDPSHSGGLPSSVERLALVRDAPFTQHVQHGDLQARPIECLTPSRVREAAFPPVENQLTTNGIGGPHKTGARGNLGLWGMSLGSLPTQEHLTYFLIVMLISSLSQAMSPAEWWHI